MDELELVRLHEDGERLVLGGPGGTQYTVTITEALRAAVRRDRPHLEHLRAEGESRLVPREIQARLRTGASVEEVAEAAGLSPENVRRFAGPVVAEQGYVIDRVQASAEGYEDSETRLGDVVTRRLEARDVDVDGVTWSATRAPGAPWTVTVSFEAGSSTRSARWSYDPSTRTPHALDDEARWLSQPESEPDRVPGAAAVFDVDAGPRASRPPQPSQDDGTHELLDDLSQRRGLRPRTPPAPPAGQEPFEGLGPSTGRDVHDDDRSGRSDAATPDGSGTVEGGTVVHLPRMALVRAGSSGQDEGTDGADDDGADDGPDHVDAPASPARSTHRTAEPPHDDPSLAPTSAGGDADDRPVPGPGPRDRRKGKNRSRAKVPSWDEIVFGARPEG
ncbi:septation protein SepH [Cellulosimicrobium arenosum]|uniref:DUF3071 domain-containing protein n=1 Tax=Cellulosimicrobium arenosum TaxID=2708133 RepID=A0A927IZ22_9MICO|nr:septation protein SepH [Cellulosimicrobium arenosum]MBD8077979.1 DUF3071 domain-containing protein [Cellulosimicrobium arenosum]